MKESLCIKEFGTISVGTSHGDFDSGELKVDQDTFNSLATFIEENQSKQGFDKAFSIFQKRGNRYIKVKNYAGVIETKQGCTIEILPKTFIGNNGEEADRERSKRLLVTMLKTLKDSPFINLNVAHLKDQANFPLLEVFISSYLDELARFTSKELRGDYTSSQENLKFIKGKLLLNKDLKVNLINKSSFYCQFDEFNSNIPPNKLIKATLLRLYNASGYIKNKKKCLKSLQHFESISKSNNIDADLDYCRSRYTYLINYGKLLKWSEVFLKNKSFTNFQGKTINQAILFPMERLFESYIAFLFRKYCQEYSVQTQDKKYCLLSQKKDKNDSEYLISKFHLKPDIVINQNEVIIDTKWKILNSKAQKYDIKEADIYQMHAYGMKYSENRPEKPRLVLIYPKSPSFEKELLQFRYGKDLLLDVMPFDFGNDNAENEIKSIIKRFYPIELPLYSNLDTETFDIAAQPTSPYSK